MLPLMLGGDERRQGVDRRGRPDGRAWPTASSTARPSCRAASSSASRSPRALAAKPDIIFADEPTGNLDSHTGAEILGFMRRAVREYGQTIVMVTHDPSAAAYADRAVFLNDGRIADEMANPTAEKILDRMKAFGDDVSDERAIPATVSTHQSLRPPPAMPGARREQQRHPPHRPAQHPRPPRAPHRDLDRHPRRRRVRRRLVRARRQPAQDVRRPVHEHQPERRPAGPLVGRVRRGRRQTSHRDPVPASAARHRPRRRGRRRTPRARSSATPRSSRPTARS